jgi:hypothetical protein
MSACSFEFLNLSFSSSSLHSYFVFVCFLQSPHAYQKVEVLQEHGIAANDITKLTTAGYHTVESVSFTRICHSVVLVFIEKSKPTQTYFYYILS